MISDFFYTISKIIKSRIFIVSLFIIGLFAVLLYRVFDLQIINENYYMSTYIQKTEKTIYKSGTRGKILDKNGKVLAYDALSYAVTIEDKIDSSDTKNSQLNHIVSQTMVTRLLLIFQSVLQRMANGNTILPPKQEYFVLKRMLQVMTAKLRM